MSRRGRGEAGQGRLAALRGLLLALVWGYLQAASMAWPSSDITSSLLNLKYGEPVWWLQLLSLAGLCLMLRSGTAPHPSHRQVMLRGWVYVTAWLVGSFWWTFVAMHTFGGLPAALGGLAVGVLAGLLALYYAVFLGTFRAISLVNRGFIALNFAVSWMLAEMARGIWLTGFGWGGSAYAHITGPLATLAPWVGAYGLSFVVAWVAMALAQVVGLGTPVASRAAHGLGLAGLLVLTQAVLPAHNAFTQSTGAMSVTLLQGNIAQDEKFEPGSGVPLALQWYAQQLQASQTSLVIAPETAIPVLPQQLPPAYWAALQQRFSQGKQAALIGTPLGDAQNGYRNTVVGLKPAQAEPWRYDKHHLVPFGEFIPPWFKWFTRMMNIPLGDFAAGELNQPSFEWQGQRLGANICYEDLFGEELAVRWRDPALAPTVLVNVSNLGWFGDGVVLDQHRSIARMRALELQRPFVLVNNSGLSGVVDHRGQVVASLGRTTRAVLQTQFEGRMGATPYAIWVARYGLLPLWGLALVLWGLIYLSGVRSLGWPHLRGR